MKSKRLLLALALALLVPWAANAQKALPYSYGFENNDLDAEGWTVQKTNSSTGISTSAMHEGSYGFQFVYSERNAYLVSPVLSGTESGVALSFYYKEYSSSYGDEQFYVGYTTDETVTDPSAFTYGNITTASLAWQLYETMLPAGTKKVAIKYVYNDAFYLYLDDFSFTATPSCVKPTNLAATLTGTTANVTWEGTATNYNIDINGNIEYRVSGPYDFEVELGTTYDIAVQANCGEETSEWATTQLITPSCSGGHIITYALADSYGDGWNGNAIIVMDENCEVIANLTISSGYSASGYFELCDDYYEFVWKLGNYPGEASWTFIDNGFPLFSGTGSSSMSTGDVLYTIGNYAYPRPTDLDAEVDKRSAELSWTENGTATTWELCINGDEANLITVTEAQLNEGVYLLENLTPETEYTAKVRSTDSEGTSAWSCTLTFTTLPRCLVPTNLAIADITAFTANATWESEVGNYDVRYGQYPAESTNREWLTYNVTQTDFYGSSSSYTRTIGVLYPAAQITGNVLTQIQWFEALNYNTGGTSTFKVYTGGNEAPETLLYTETFTPQAQGLQTVTLTNPVVIPTGKNLWITLTETGGYTLAVGACTDDNNRWIMSGSNWITWSVEGLGWIINGLMETIDLDAVTWATGTTTTNAYAMESLIPETCYLFQVRANCGGEDGVSAWQTAVFTTLPSCQTPEGLVVSDVTARDATFTWTAEEGATFQYCYVANPAEGYVPTDAEFVNETQENTLTFTHEFEPETNYVFYLRKKCSDTDFSEIISVAFTTDVACHAPTSLSVTGITQTTANASWTSEAENFDVRYGHRPTATAENWLTYGVTPITSSYGSSSADTRTWGVKYRADEVTGNLLTQVRYYETGYNSGGYTIINIYSGGDDAPGELIYSHYAYPSTTGWILVDFDQPVSIVSDENLWITLTEYGTYVLSVGECTSDDNRWIKSGSAWETWGVEGYGWLIEGNMETVDWSSVVWTPGTTTENTYAMENLDSETDYVFEVRTNCGGENGESVWVLYYFTTLSACLAPSNLTASDITAHTASLTWEGFKDTYDVAYYRKENNEPFYTEDFTSGEIPSDWTNDETYPWTVVDGHMESGNAGVHSSISSIYMTATFDADGAIEFDAQCMGEGTSYDVCRFYIDGTVKFTKGANGEQWDHYIYDVAAGTHTFQWVFSKDTSVNGTGDHFAVDNISLFTYNVINGPTAEGVTSPYLLEGLAAETEYFVKVKGHGCPDTEWSQLISFTTDIACPAPTNLDYDNLLPTSVDLTWVDGGSAWQICVNENEEELINVTLDDVTIEETTITYTMTVNPEEDYIVKVRANCGEEGVSQWSDKITFTVPSNCSEPINLESSNLTYESATLAWEGYQETYNVQYRTAALVNTAFTDGFEQGSGNWTLRNCASQTGITTTASYVHSGNAAFAFRWNSNPPQYLISPEITGVTEGMFLEFYYKNASDSWPETFQIGFSSTDNETESFAFGTQYSASDGQWHLYSESIPAGTKYICWKLNSNNQFYLCIDDIAVGERAEWIPENGIEGFTTTLNGLNPDTRYEWQVQGVNESCEGGLTDWSASAYFETAPLPIQTIQLAKGWNWISAYVEADDLLVQLEESLGENGLEIWSSEYSTAYDEGWGWWGDLDDEGMTNDQMYMVLVSDDCTVQLQGTPVTPENYDITINPGWNWIGYPNTVEMTLDEALANFEAEEGDEVWNSECATQYSPDWGWWGDVETFVPGTGYMYYYNGSDAQTLVFATASAKARVNVPGNGLLKMTKLQPARSMVKKVISEDRITQPMNLKSKKQ